MSVLTERRVETGSPAKDNLVSRKVLTALKAKAQEGILNLTGPFDTSPVEEWNGIRTKYGFVIYAAPVGPTYSIEELNTFMESLIPQEEDLRPKSLIRSEVMPDGALRYGVMCFEQLLQRREVETDEVVIFPTEDQMSEAKRLGISGGGRVSKQYKNHIQKTYVVIVPDADLLPELAAAVQPKKMKIDGRDTTMGCPPTADRLVRYAYLDSGKIPR